MSRNAREGVRQGWPPGADDGRPTGAATPRAQQRPNYRHLVELQSGTNGYVSVTLYKTGNRYDGELADFSFDYWTLELHFVSTVGKAMTESIINAFRRFYTPRNIRVSYDKYEYEDEDTTYEYDETDRDKPPVKRLNK